MVQLNFNANQYEPSLGAADVLESGVYTVQIVNSEVKQTRKGDGYMLVFSLSCMDQAVAGRKLTARLNIHNPNAQAVEIAYKELSAISHVVGVLNWQDTQQLHGRPFKVSVEKVERSDKPGSFSNNILAYMDYAGNPPSPGNSAGGTSQAAIPTAPAAVSPAPASVPAPQPNPGQMAPGATQPQWPTATAPASVPAPGAAAAPAPMPQPATVPAPALAPQPQMGVGGVAPWQAGTPAPTAGTPVPPWQQQ